jgi:hypothetical protein
VARLGDFHTNCRKCGHDQHVAIDQDDDRVEITVNGAGRGLWWQLTARKRGRPPKATTPPDG